jgi:transglutaminase-like putative cysteine protease
MRFRIRHVTRYHYSRPVFLEPHQFRLLPRGGGSQRVHSYSLNIQPYPAGITEILDAESNPSHYAWFGDLTTHLTVDSCFEVETLRVNPFDYILSDLALATVPVVYPESLLGTLQPYCSSRGADRSVYALARATAQEVEWQTVPFLSALTRKIHSHIEHVVREDGAAFPAAETLRLRMGACRDVAVLFIEACRTLGLAARFVSGYELGAMRQDRAFMHAWAEVYLPGGGWRGFDPSRGLATAESHIAVAAARIPELAAPISGSFRGTGVDSEISFDIHMEEVDAAGRHRTEDVHGEHQIPRL